MKCEICERTGDESYFEKHHLFPGSKKKNKNSNNETILVCKTCGDQIHLMFNNKKLCNELNNLEALKTNMESYILWIKNKPLEKNITMAKKKRI